MVKKESIPNTSGIDGCLNRIDYSDTFSITNHKNSLAEIAKMALGTAPAWVKGLMKLRNSIVGLFGLKTEMPMGEDPPFEVGGKVAFFKIYEILDNEVILGQNDSHLNFRVSIFDDKSEVQNIKMTTLVEYNNTFGKFYMTLITPFHKLIVKRMLAQAISSDV